LFDWGSTLSSSRPSFVVGRKLTPTGRWERSPVGASSPSNSDRILPPVHLRPIVSYSATTWLIDVFFQYFSKY